MITSLLRLVYQTIIHNQNQFASGGMLLMALGALGASLRKIPAHIWAWIVNQSTLNLNITDDRNSFHWIKLWYLEQPHSRRSRRVDVFHVGEDGGVEDGKYSTGDLTERLGTRFSPAPGRHWFFYKKRPLVITFSRSDEKTVKSVRTESFKLTTIGRNQQYWTKLMDEAHKVYVEATKGKASLHLWNGGWETTDYSPRSLESVILPEEQKKTVVEDIEEFLKSKKWYEEMGIPYHRGYLFYGPPGTGKTSLVTGLSDYFSSRVYLLQINQHNDSTLARAVHNCAEGAFIVLEDVDCLIPESRVPSKAKSDQSGQHGSAFTDEDEDDESVPVAPTEKKETLWGVSLSGLLNILDGLQSPVGAIFFMTTNHRDKLDPALLRPGRIDREEYIGEASNFQKLALYEKFFTEDHRDDASQFIAAHPADTMADWQQLLMVERNRRIRELREIRKNALAASGS